MQSLCSPWRYTLSDNKVRELIAIKVLHTSLPNTTAVVFKVLPLGSYAPMPVPSPPFKTIWNWFCEMALWAAVVLLLMPPMSSKCLRFNISFIFGNRKKKSLLARFGEQAGCSNTVICLAATNCLTDSAVWAGALFWCKIQKFLVKMWGRLYLPYIMQPFEYFQKSKLERLFVQLVQIHNEQSLIISKSQQNCFDSWFVPTEVLVVGNWQSSVVHFAASFQGRVGRAMFHHLWWYGPKISYCLLKKILANCGSSLLLFFGEPLCDHFLHTIFPHVEIFSYEFRNCFSVDIHLLCYALDSQLTIFTQNLTNVCIVFFSSACCWPSWSLFVSDTFSSLRKTFHPLLTPILLTWRIWWEHNNASKWQMGFNSAFKGSNCCFLQSFIPVNFH